MIGFPPSVKRTARRQRPGLWRDGRGATAVEYGLILAVIVLTMMAALQGLANQTVGLWGNVNTKVAAATGN